MQYSLLIHALPVVLIIAAHSSALSVGLRDSQLTHTELVDDDDGYASAHNTCDPLINCETYYDQETGYWSIRMKEGMGPGSKWFAENVAIYEDTEPDGFITSVNGEVVPSNATDVREDEDDTLDGLPNVTGATHSGKRATESEHHKHHPKHPSYTYKMDRGRNDIPFGSVGPREAAKSAHKHCQGTSCARHWIIPTKKATGNQVVYEVKKGHIDIRTSASSTGQHITEYLIEALTHIATVKAKSHKGKINLCVNVVGAPPICHYKHIEQHTGPARITITRIHHSGKHRSNPTLAGMLEMTFKFEAPSGKQECEQIVQQLGVLAGAGGPIASIGGGFFGTYAPQIC